MFFVEVKVVFVKNVHYNGITNFNSEEQLGVLQMNKRIGAFFIFAVMLLVFVGCGTGNKDKTIKMELKTSACSEVTKDRYLENLSDHRNEKKREVTKDIENTLNQFCRENKLEKLQLQDKQVMMYQVDLYFENTQGKQVGEKLHVVLDVLSVVIAGKHNVVEVGYADQFVLTETVVNEDKSKQEEVTQNFGPHSINIRNDYGLVQLEITGDFLSKDNTVKECVMKGEFSLTKKENDSN